MKRYIAFFLTTALLLGVTACGKPDGPSEQNSDASSQSDDLSAQSDAASDNDTASDTVSNAASDTASDSSTAPAGDAPAVHIRLAEWENIEWDTFQSDYVTMKVPKGWEVTETGEPPFVYYRVFRPAAEGSVSNTGWTTTACYKFYHTQEYADKLNQEMGEGHYATMTGPTTREFFEAFWALPGMDVTRFEVVAEVSNGDSVIEDFHPTDSIGTTVTDNSSILAHWTQRGVEGTGLYSTPIVDVTFIQKTPDLSTYEKTGDLNDYLNAPTIEQDWGNYEARSPKWFCAPTDEFDNWLPILMESYNSKVPTQRYWDETNEYIRKMFNSTNTVGPDTYGKDTTTDTWWDMYQNREKSEDIMREKQSDATLGYERVYDSDTGNVYRAYSGFMDDYSKSGIYTDGDNGSRYSYATDDQYTMGYSGWIDGYGDYLADSNK